MGIEGSGQQELLNWYVLVGAREQLGHAAPTRSSMTETYVYNSPKVFAVYQP